MTAGDRLLLERTHRLLVALLAERGIRVGARREEALALCDDTGHRLDAERANRQRANVRATRPRSPAGVAVMPGQQALELEP